MKELSLSNEEVRTAATDLRDRVISNIPVSSSDDDDDDDNLDVMESHSEAYDPFDPLN
jgi:hypothetical protein